MSRYGDLSGDPEEYNPSRENGSVSSESADVQDMLNNHDGTRSVSDMKDREVVAVWLKRIGFPRTKFEFTQINDGVWIDRTGYMNGWKYSRFIEVMRDTDGIEYDGNVNRATPELVDRLRDEMAIDGDDE